MSFSLQGAIRVIKWHFEIYIQEHFEDILLVY